jgi:pilus assembly protein Flp/PilA
MGRKASGLRRSGEQFAIAKVAGLPKGDIDMNTRILTIFAKLRNDENGATAIEYGLIAAGISVVIITAVSLVGGGVTNTFNTIAAAL